MAEDNPIEVMLDLDNKGKKSKNKRAEMLDKVVNAVDAEVGDAYSYSGSDTYRQMGEAWRRYYQQPFGNEERGYSTYVSGMLTQHVNQTRAWAVSKYAGTSAPIVKFRPRGAEDVIAAEAATEFTNHVFRNKLKGADVIDNIVFNAALLKIAPLRVYAKPMAKAPDEYEYKFEGSEEEFIEDFAKFEANAENEAVLGTPPTQESIQSFGPEGEELTPNEAGELVSPQTQQPVPPQDIKIKVEMKWNLELPDDKEIALDIISPGSFFVSRQAEDLDQARMVAQIAIERISDLKMRFPDAPKVNDRDEDDFWERLQSEYIEWFRENEWLERWSYDSLGLNETEDSQQSDDAAGLGSREVFVMDAEIWMDLEDSGDAKLYHVVKAGRYVLGLEEISERSFICGSLIPTGNKWIGLSFHDLLNHDLREASTNTRAFTNATLDAAHPHAVVDFAQVDQKDVQDIRPGTMFRVKPNAPQSNRPAIDWAQAPGPDPSVLQAVEFFKQDASTFTGVGQGFQGGTMQDTKSMRIGEDAAKVIENHSSLMQNYYSQKLDDMLACLMVKIWNTAVKAGVKPEMYHTKGEWEELDPAQQEARYEFIINADVGIDAKREKLEKATAMMQMMLQPIPGVQFLPQAGYEIGKMWLEANDMMDVDNYLVNPQTQEMIGQDPQVMHFMNQAEAQMQQQAMAMVEQARQEVLQMPDVMLKQAQAELATAKAMDVAPRRELDAEKAAVQMAIMTDKEDRLDERAAVDKAIDMERVDLQRWELEEEVELAKKEFAAGRPTSNIGAG